VEDDPLHKDAIHLIEEETNPISQASLLELDLILKGRGFSLRERENVWRLLSAYIPESRIAPLTPEDLALASKLEENLDYFDSLVAAQAINRGMDIATTDEEVGKAISRYTAES